MKELCCAIVSSLTAVFKILKIEYVELNEDRLNQWCIQELNRSMVIAALIIQNYMRKYIAAAKQKSQLRRTVNKAVKKLMMIILNNQSSLPAVLFNDVCDKISSLQQPSESSLVNRNILNVPNQFVGNSSLSATSSSSSVDRDINFDWSLVKKSLETFEAPPSDTEENEFLRITANLEEITRQLSSMKLDVSQISSLPFDLSSVIPESEVNASVSGTIDWDRSSSKGVAGRLRNVVQKWRLHKSSTIEFLEDSLNNYPPVPWPNKWKRISRRDGEVKERQPAYLHVEKFPESNEVEIVVFSGISVLPHCTNSSADNNGSTSIASNLDLENLALLSFRQDKCAVIIQKLFRRFLQLIKQEYIPFHTTHSVSDHSLVTVARVTVVEDEELDCVDQDIDHWTNQYNFMNPTDEELYFTEQILTDAEVFHSDALYKRDASTPDSKEDNDMNIYATRIQNIFKKFRAMKKYQETVAAYNLLTVSAAKINRQVRRYIATLRVSHLRHERLVEEILTTCGVRRELLLVQKQISQMKLRKIDRFSSSSRPITPSDNKPSQRSNRRRLAAAAVVISRYVRRFLASKFVDSLREDRLVTQVLTSCSARRELLLVQKKIAILMRKNGRRHRRLS